jgi:serine/threonine protein kinase
MPHAVSPGAYTTYSQTQHYIFINYGAWLFTEFKDLMTHLLQKNPHDRLSIVEIQHHCWVLGIPAKDS